MLRGCCRWCLIWLVVSLALSLWAASVVAVEAIPAQLSDEAFWKLIDIASEPDGLFIDQNFISNETKYPSVVQNLKTKVAKDGVYIGVGPEQNFTYIAAIRPRIAFIVDIRRQNLAQHLMYKALFELSNDRADFLSRLFSRKRPEGLSDRSTPAELFAAYDSAAPDDNLFQNNFQAVTRLLVETHGFRLVNDDKKAIETILRTFFDWGSGTNYYSGTPGGAAIAQGSRVGIPTFKGLMTATGTESKNLSFLATAESYAIVRDMQMRNMIVPVVGDFAGPKAIPSIGQYLKDHSATVTVFYVSNVEGYLFRTDSGVKNGGWTKYIENVSTLPLDAASMFVRFQGAAGGGRLDSIRDTLRANEEGRLQNQADLFPK